MKKAVFILFLLAGMLCIPRESQALPTVDLLTYDRLFNGVNSNNEFFVFGSLPDGFVLSDGTVGEAGAGGMYWGDTSLDHFERIGDKINYYLNEPASFGTLPNGHHFMLGQGFNVGWDYIGRFTVDIANAGPLVIKAQYGTPFATLDGFVTPLLTDPFLTGSTTFLPTSGYGAVVPFSLKYTLLGSVWDEDSIIHGANLEVSGHIDFAPHKSEVIPEPTTLLLVGSGLLGAFAKRNRKARSRYQESGKWEESRNRIPKIVSE